MTTNEIAKLYYYVVLCLQQYFYCYSGICTFFELVWHKNVLNVARLHCCKNVLALSCTLFLYPIVKM